MHLSSLLLGLDLGLPLFIFERHCFELVHHAFEPLGRLWVLHLWSWHWNLHLRRLEHRWRLNKGLIERLLVLRRWLHRRRHCAHRIHTLKLLEPLASLIQRHSSLGLLLLHHLIVLHHDLSTLLFLWHNWLLLFKLGLAHERHPLLPLTLLGLDYLMSLRRLVIGLGFLLFDPAVLPYGP